MHKVAIAAAEDYSLQTVKEALKASFKDLGYDTQNPLGGIIKPGMQVFIKPNWVASRWRESCSNRDDLYCVITHPSVIEAVADFVDIALKGEGRIIIGDNPSIDADFNELLETAGLRRLTEKYRVPCELLDLRPLVCVNLKDYGDKTKMCEQNGDPRGYTEVNLRQHSLFHRINSRLFRGVFKQRDETIQAHSRGNQLYTFANSIYHSDVYISIPKMKTHHKAGVTLNLKGLVGTVGIKNQLIHWRQGFPFIGGDEYPSFFKWLKGTFFQKVKSRGSWEGNDTIWRMVIDLYNAFATKERSCLSIVDGILGGQGNGPFCPTGICSKTLVVGESLVCTDIVVTRLMGFNPMAIPYLRYLSSEYPVNEIQIHGLGQGDAPFFTSGNRHLAFAPPDSWPNLLG